MITILDLKAEVGKLTLLRGRTPQMTEVERKGSGAFATLAPFRDGNIFSAKFAGDGAWERHPNGDELVQIVGGSPDQHAARRALLRRSAPDAGRLRLSARDGLGQDHRRPRVTRETEEQDWRFVTEVNKELKG